MYSSLDLEHDTVFCIVRYDRNGDDEPPADGDTVTVSIGQDKSTSTQELKLSQGLKDQGPSDVNQVGVIHNLK